MRITVVGGGILGLSSALALAEAGHRVTVLEQANAGSGATARAAGILSAMTWNDDDYRLIAATRGLIGESISLAMSMGQRTARHAWRPAPSLCIAAGEGLRTLDTIQERLERMTEETERLDHRRIERDFPALTSQPGEEALVAQEDGVIEAGELVGALRARLDAEGVVLVEQEPVERLAVHDGVCTGTRSPRSPEADAVVVAGGAWTRGLLAASGIPVPVQAYRTQLASLGMVDAADVPILHDLVHHFYTRPESDASFLAGDGTQLQPFVPGAYNESADAAFVESLAGRVVDRFAQGHAATVRAGWAGLCVATPDRRPLCGPLHDVDGLHVLTGDNGFGLMRGLGLGSRLADAVGGRVEAATDPRRFPRTQPLDFEMREGYGDLAAK